MSDWNMELTRRLFLQAALAGTGIGLLGPLGCQRSATDEPRSRAKPLKRLTVIHLYGGNDGLNTVVPITLDNYAARRGALALDKRSLRSLNAGPHATAAYGLHPSLRHLAAIWADGDLAVINKVGYPNPNGSHFVSQEVWSSGVRGEFAPLHISPSGWIARYADQFAPTPTGAISVGETNPKDMLGGATSRFHVRSLESFNLMPSYVRRHLDDASRFSIEPNDSRRLGRIMEVMQAVERSGSKRDIRDAMAGATEMLDVVREALAGYKSSVVYPTTTPATYLRDIATLCKAGLDARIYFTGFGDFDHHASQANRHTDVLSRLDTGLAAFVEDMKAMGIWDDMVVAVVSEFGRRNYANGSNGTDHGQGNFALVLGGGVKGGLYGSALTTADLDAESLPVEIDFRSIYREVLEKHLGADPTNVFPEPQDLNTVLGLFAT
jgi:uncharacterized protein (DUF1501 family)